MPCWFWYGTLKCMGAVTVNKLLIGFAVLVTTGCSHKMMYNGLRANQQNECLKEPPTLYSECIEPIQKTYEEYERERKELLEKEITNDKKW